MRRNNRRSFELLEKRELLAFTPCDATLFASGLGYKDPHAIAAISAITTTGSKEPITLFKDTKSTQGSFAPSTALSTATVQTYQASSPPQARLILEWRRASTSST